MTTEPSYVGYSYADGVSRVTLVDGARGNPIHPGSVRELHQAVCRSRTDRARVVVLAAEGRFFSVGGDLGAFTGADDLGAYVDDLADALHRVVSELVRSDAVVVSAVQGAAAGAGFPLAAVADVVVASSAASFSLGYTRVGLTVDGGASLLAHTLGLHRTLRMALLNDVLTAEEAYAAGLVARVVAPEDLTGTVDDLAARLAAGSGPTQAAVKRLVRDTVEPAPERALREETLAIRRAASSPDAGEGIAAFLEKRPPVFSTS